MKLFKIFAVLLIALFIYTPASYSGFEIPDTDGLSDNERLMFFFDLRDRETFVQLTNVDPNATAVHVQIWDVSNNCNENNFFDTYTPADTHVYDIRNIQTNDGSPSGVILPDNAYGFVSIINSEDARDLIGNLRVIDNAGYEYRTNAIDINGGFGPWSREIPNITFNYNTKGDVTLSDVVGISTSFMDSEVSAADILETWFSFDVDIYNLDEVPFSCRNIIFACTDQDHPLYEELLDVSGDASVASFEYGINNAIPHSRGGELLCPGNNISDGFVTLNLLNDPPANFVGFIGLNNGNGRGSMDSFWHESGFDLLTNIEG